MEIKRTVSECAGRDALSEAICVQDIRRQLMIPYIVPLMFSACDFDYLFCREVRIEKTQLPVE